MYFSRTKVTAKLLTTQMATSAASPRPRPRQQGPRCARQEPRTALQKLYPGRVERCQWGPLLRQCRRDSFSDFWVILCKRLHVSLHDCARHSETAESKNLLHSPSEKTFKRLFHLNMYQTLCLSYDLSCWPHLDFIEIILTWFHLHPCGHSFSVICFSFCKWWAIGSAFAFLYNYQFI